jgi:hypothetical protein
MKQITAICTIVVFSGAFLATVGASSLTAQSLSGLHVGVSSTDLSKLGPSSGSDSYKGMAVRRWVFPNGNELSATVGTDDKVVYIESDWNGKNADSGCDLLGLRFGVTTLSDIRKRFGSNGFGYEARGSSIETQDGLVMMNSYAVCTSVITFYTMIDRQEYSRVKTSTANPSPADYARLDGISIAEESYAKSEWGDRVYDPAYKKVDWK